MYVFIAVLYILSVKMRDNNLQVFLSLLRLHCVIVQVLLFVYSRKSASAMYTVYSTLLTGAAPRRMVAVSDVDLSSYIRCCPEGRQLKEKRSNERRIYRGVCC